MQEIYLIIYLPDPSFNSIKDKADKLDKDGGVVYTGNADVLKQVCPEYMVKKKTRFLYDWKLILYVRSDN